MQNSKSNLNLNLKISSITDSIPDPVFSQIQSMNIDSDYISAIDIMNNSPMQKVIRGIQETSKAFNQSIFNNHSVLFNDAASIIKDDSIKSMSAFSFPDSKSFSNIAFGSIHEQLNEIQKVVRSSISTSVSPLIEAVSFIQADTFKSLSSVIDSITDMKLNVSALSSLDLSYDQYKPVSDILETIYNSNSVPDTEVLASITLPMSERKPIPVIALIGLMISIFGFILAVHTKLQPNPIPDKVETLINLETQQLQLQQKQYDETVRHNIATEENDQTIEELLIKMVDMMEKLSTEE
jgi:hypothetical protein